MANNPPQLDINRLRSFLEAQISRELEASAPAAGEMRAAVEQRLRQALLQNNLQLPDALVINLSDDIFNNLVGYGPLQALLDDPAVSEIMVSGAQSIYVERNGTLAETGLTFRDDAHVLRIIDRMIHPLGRRVDRETPMTDARLPDGSRVNVIIPPVAIDGPCITIRKFLKNKLTIQQLINLGSITPFMAEFLQACVAARLNILITGNTSSGKTTLLNILTSFIPGEERIITIEDAAELQLKQKYVVRLETKLPSLDNTGGITTRDLVRNALRMRPDRIVVGEVRGGEAMDMLQAMNTGHSGSLCTLHANSPRDAVARLETMAMMAGLDMPLLAVRKQIAAAINLIVHHTRLQDGTRKITQIAELSGMESDVVTLSDIFKFEQRGVGPDGKILGELKATGIRPLFSPRLEVAGFRLRGEIFGAGRSV